MSAAAPKILERARAEIRALQPYSSARMEAGAARVMLNANESPWAPPENEGSTLNRYPDPQPPALRARLAELYEVAPGQVLVGRGSDEAIDLLVRAFCRSGEDAILVSPPTFGMYAVAARVQGAAVVEAPLTENFGVDVDAILAHCDAHVKLVFVCSPNNPVGAMVPTDAIERLAAALRERAVVVVDEAYLEFAEGLPSATKLLGWYDNLAVLRTLSKAFALAGARVGSVVAHAELIALLRRIQAPYPLPGPCVDAALTALSPAGIAHSRARVAILLAERARLAQALPQADGVLAVYPSSANFLCVRFADAGKAFAALSQHGILVRDVSRYAGLAGCLRITIGTPQENAQVLAALGCPAPEMKPEPAR